MVLLIGSNVFMTAAWYWHLRYKEVPITYVILISWGLVFVEYCLAVPANRYGSAVYNPAQLKTIQDVITFVVFAGFSYLYLQQPITLSQGFGFALIAAGHSSSSKRGDSFCESFRRNDTQDASGCVVGEQIDGTIRPLPHVANALAQFLQKTLLFHDLVARQLEPRQQLELQRTIQQAALPAGDKVARVKSHTRRSDRRRPMPDRGYDALHLGLAGAHWCAVVVDAKAHARPAVVFAFRDDIDFVTAHGPVLLLPQFSVGRIEGETLRVAQTVGPDFRQRSVRADEWIVGGGAPSGVMRTILPMWLSSFCANSFGPKWSPSVTNRLPSGACTMRQPILRPRETGPFCRKMTFTSSSRGDSSSIDPKSVV